MGGWRCFFVSAGTQKYPQDFVMTATFCVYGYSKRYPHDLCDDCHFRCSRVLKKIPVRLCGDNYFQCPRVLKKIPASLRSDSIRRLPTQTLCTFTRVLKKIPAKDGIYSLYIAQKNIPASSTECLLCPQVLKKIPKQCCAMSC